MAICQKCKKNKLPDKTEHIESERGTLCKKLCDDCLNKIANYNYNIMKNHSDDIGRKAVAKMFSVKRDEEENDG